MTKKESGDFPKYKLSQRAKELIDQKGYHGAFILAGRSLLRAIASILICYAYLSALKMAAPLSSFPPQALILPVVSILLAVYSILCTVFWIVIGRRIKRMTN